MMIDLYSVKGIKNDHEKISSNKQAHVSFYLVIKESSLENCPILRKHWHTPLIAILLDSFLRRTH